MTDPSRVKPREPPEGAGDPAESDRDDIARGAGVNYLGYVARLGSRAPFLFLAGILYGEAAFGVYTFGTAIAETAAALSLFGMKRSLSKLMSDAVARGEGLHRAIAGGIVLALCLGTAITLAVAGGAGLLALAFDLPSAARAVMILALAIPMIVASDILLVAIRFTRQMRFEVYARSIAEPITLTVAVVVLYYLGFRDLGLAIGYVAALTVAAAATAVFFVRLYPVRELLRVRLRWGEIRELVAFTGPTAGYELTMLMANRVDVFLVSWFTSASAVGIYGMAREFSTVTKKIRQGFEPILRPVISDSLATGDLGRTRDQLAMVSRWILSAQAPVILAFVFYADDLLGLLGGGFAGGALVLVLLMAGDAIEGGFGVNEIPIVYLRPRANIVIGAGWLVLTVGAGIALVPRLGAEGMALAVALALAGVNAARVAVNRAELDLDTVEVKLLKPLAATLPAGAAVWALERYLAPDPLPAVALGLPLLLAAYFGAYRLLGLEEEDRAQLRRVKARFR